ncbi:P-loop containing nucleoside triphosphate hydrolase protein [Phlyctochytrium arcticum]|nr:P-loop containing nucleoside triphosphate hydrolase protein [Phlyctochytrium arcticum]
MAFPPERIRNIGIVAHIDAGKTTTTERMLYYVGYTKRIGEVHDGTTVTDFLKPERERGITITSACIPFSWRSHRINLIDTPGHVDFTIEVERSMRVLDGAVCVLDAVAGVEAQTETVWRQANRYRVPRVVFVNKMDREGATLVKTVKAMERRLTGWGKPLVCHWPVVRDASASFNGSGSGGPAFEGIVDLVTMELVDWKKDPRTGSVVTRQPMSDEESLGKNQAHLYADAVQARIALVEKLSELDDTIVDIFLDNDGDHMKVPAAALQAALRRVTLNGQGIPVFCGASFKNIGVQPVLDAVVDYLPSPSERTPPVAILPNGKSIDIHNTSDLCALAFKVMHDPKRGPLVFVRVYSGTLERGSVLFNPNQQTKERVQKVLQMYADDYEEIPSVTAGNIAALIGLKETRTGETLILASQAKKSQPTLETIPIPPPVFVRSCEPASASDERSLATALKALTREDPSVHVRYDSETGQTLLSGMGELHLEITADRLAETHRVNCKMGKVLISYRETLAFTESEAASEGVNITHAHDKDVFGKHARVDITLHISPIVNPFDMDEQWMDAGSAPSGGNIINYAVPSKHIQSPSYPNIPIPGQSGFPTLSEIHSALQSGIQGALSGGPLHNFPISNLRITVESLTLYSAETSHQSAIRAAAHRAIQSALHDKCKLLEPIMDLSVRVPDKYVGSISKDISGSRRGHIVALESDELFQTVKATIPLSSLVGYATQLRGLTAGTGEFSMNLKGYAPVPATREKEILEELRGY